MARRVVAVVMKAAGFLTPSALCRRSNASCATSSASATLPSIR